MNQKISRLEKAFLRQGIQLSLNNNVINLTRLNDQVSATVLLPDEFVLEEKAVLQLMDFAAVNIPGLQGQVVKACATPDFHPGHQVPVGSVIATTANMVIPAAVGTDINCGMRLISTGLNINQFDANNAQITQKLAHVLLHNGRDVPMTGASFKTLFDHGVSACLESVCNEGLWRQVDRKRMLDELAYCIGLEQIISDAKYAPPALLDEGRLLLRDPNLGTVGSGNHFVELQVVDEVLDRHQAWQSGLKIGDVVTMIHTGSRDVGFYVGNRWMDKAKESWPGNLKRPESGLYALADEQAQEYLKAMGVAARYAWLNRIVLTELVRQCFKDVFGQDSSRLIVDVPHNIIFPEQGMNIHRKGATPAKHGDLALIPGSMGDYSYLVEGLGNAEWLWSCSHGAGRKIRRQVARSKQYQATEHHSLVSNCITLKAERRIEEAPSTYKDVTSVIQVQTQAGLLNPIIKLRPLLTFKA